MDFSVRGGGVAVAALLLFASRNFAGDFGGHDPLPLAAAGMAWKNAGEPKSHAGWNPVWSFRGSGRNAIALSPDGRILVTAGLTHELIVVDPATGNILQREPFPPEVAPVRQSRLLKAY